jgi:hypothetical protein
MAAILVIHSKLVPHYTLSSFNKNWGIWENQGNLFTKILLHQN